MREWGPHTFEKISILGDHLSAFAKAATKAPNRVYIDTMAGDTINVLRGTDQQFAGSAEIALGVKPPFTHIRLFEKSANRAASLRELAAANPSGRDVQVIAGDCNEQMATVLAGLPNKAPTFAFLDPDGFELSWRTVQLLADHKRAYAEANDKAKVEMWILFSSSGMVRMLGSNRATAEAQRLPERVARFYGAWGPWETVWQARLDGRMSPGDAKQAYLFLYMDRLVGLGYKHVLARPITTRGEFYVMVFASDHSAGQRIMRWAQERDRVRPQAGTLFDVPETRDAYEDLHTGWRDQLGIDLPPWGPIE